MSSMDQNVVRFAMLVDWLMHRKSNEIQTIYTLRGRKKGSYISKIWTAIYSSLATGYLSGCAILLRHISCYISMHPNF